MCFDPKFQFQSGSLACHGLRLDGQRAYPWGGDDDDDGGDDDDDDDVDGDDYMAPLREQELGKDIFLTLFRFKSLL